MAAACYHRGALLVAEGAASDSAVAGRTRLLTATRDLTQPPLGTSVGAAGGSVGLLRESITELAIAIPGAPTFSKIQKNQGNWLPQTTEAQAQAPSRHPICVHTRPRVGTPQVGT